MGDAAEPRQLDVGDVRAEQSSGKRVPELVQQDRQQKAHDDDEPRRHHLRVAGGEVGIGKEQQHQHEHHVEIDRDPGDATNLHAREHGPAQLPPLLRMASVRSRSALSRMNPSASFWS